MSSLPTNSGIPMRMQEPQTRVLDTFAGIRAPGPSQVQPSELPRWQSEMFEVAQAMSGLSGTLGSLSNTWGGIAVQTGEMAGDLAFTEMTPEQQREASAVSWADFEKKYPQFRGSSPFMSLRIRENAGRSAVEQRLGKVFADNAERLSDPLSDTDPAVFAAEQLNKIVGELKSPYAQAAAVAKGGDMIGRFNGAVMEAKRKRTVLQHSDDFQRDVKDILEESLSAEGDMTAIGLPERFKAVQDNYHTITGESGNLAVFGAVQSMAETLISSGRYSDARELLNGMSGYSANGEVTFGKMYAEQFAAIRDKADRKEAEDVRGSRADDAYRVARAATEELFKIDANKLESMTEGDLKALAQQTAANANLDPSYHGEVYDTLLQIRANQLDRLNRGKESDQDDLALMMRIRRDSMKPGANYDGLEEEVIGAYKAGHIKRDTAMSLLGQIESGKNIYADAASPGIREARGRLKFGTGINPRDLNGTALVEYDQIIAGLETQFDQAIVIARDEVIRDMNAKGIPVNADSINHHLGQRANEIATELMSKADSQVKAFRSKYEPRALLKEYLGASTVPQMAQESINEALKMIASSQDAKANPGLSEAANAAQFDYLVNMRKFISDTVVRLSQTGLEGQDLYNAVDAEVLKHTREQTSWLSAASSGMSGTFARSSEGFAGRGIASQYTKMNVKRRSMTEPVPEETWGMTQASRFGNDFRDWVGELSGETDEAAIADARKNAKVEAAKFVQQVGSPISNNITISGRDILRDGERDADATATYWNAKVQWDGLTITEVRTGRTSEGLELPDQYKLSRFTRIKEMDTADKLRAAYGQYLQDRTGPLADYMDALNLSINPEDVVDILRVNLDEIGEGGTQ
jgi:hypothetical protein